MDFEILRTKIFLATMRTVNRWNIREEWIDLHAFWSPLDA
jgi:hypothetical protein